MSSSPSTARGCFILFEGLDRSGKTTQSYALTAALQKLGIKTIQRRFPNRTTVIGEMISGYLNLTRPAVDMDDRCIHLLFSANRWEAAAAIRKELADGNTLVIDRYSYSGIAYSAAKGLDADWCRACDVGLPRPDVIFYMNLDADEAAKRGQYGEERYEKAEFQTLVGEQFSKIRKEQHTWQVLDAGRDADELKKDILHMALVAIDASGTTPLTSIE